jgi:uncharacterized membrane protein
MREVMLIIHFIGLSMGLGTGIGFLIFGIVASKLEKEEAKKFMLNAFSLVKMAQIGLVLLIISGLYLMTPFWASLAVTPLLIAKLTLVVILIVIVIVNSAAMGKAKKGDLPNQRKKIQALGRITLIIVLLIVILAVYTFH